MSAERSRQLDFAGAKQSSGTQLHLYWMGISNQQPAGVWQQIVDNQEQVLRTHEAF